MDEIETIRARWAAVSPWGYDETNGMVVIPGEPDGHPRGFPVVVAQTWDKAERDYRDAHANGERIGAAPDDIRALLAEIDRLRAGLG